MNDLQWPHLHTSRIFYTAATELEQCRSAVFLIDVNRCLHGNLLLGAIKLQDISCCRINMLRVETTRTADYLKTSDMSEREYTRTVLISYSPTSFWTRFNMESFEGSATISYHSSGRRKHTIRMVLRGYLEKGRKWLLIFVDSGAYFLCYLFRSKWVTGHSERISCNGLRAD